MNKKIITIAEIVFALIFVVLLSVFMATINSKGNSANNQLVSTLEATDGTSLSSYDGTTVKGSSVITALGNYKSIGGDLKLTLLVKTAAYKSGDSNTGTLTDAGIAEGESAAVEGYKYGYDNTGDKHGEELKQYSATAGNDHYINPAANFNCRVIENSNGVAIGIYFEQQTTSEED